MPETEERPPPTTERQSRLNPLSLSDRASRWVTGRLRRPHDLPRDLTPDLPPEDHHTFMDSKAALQLIERHQLMVWPRMSRPGWNAARFNRTLANKNGEAWLIPTNYQNVGQGETVLHAALDALEKAGIE